MDVERPLYIQSAWRKMDAFDPIGTSSVSNFTLADEVPVVAIDLHYIEIEKKVS